MKPCGQSISHMNKFLRGQMKSFVAPIPNLTFKFKKTVLNFL